MKNKYINSGLVPAGTDEDGDNQFIGTEQQWKEADNLTDIEFEAYRDKIDDDIYESVLKGKVLEQDVAEMSLRQKEDWLTGNFDDKFK